MNQLKELNKWLYLVLMVEDLNKTYVPVLMKQVRELSIKCMCLILMVEDLNKTYV